MGKLVKILDLKLFEEFLIDTRFIITKWQAVYDQKSQEVVFVVEYDQKPKNQI